MTPNLFVAVTNQAIRNRHAEVSKGTTVCLVSSFIAQDNTRSAPFFNVLEYASIDAPTTMSEVHRSAFENIQLLVKGHNDLLVAKKEGT